MAVVRTCCLFCRNLRLRYLNPKYTVWVTFGHHCFTEEYKPGDDTALFYLDLVKRDPRSFDLKRWQLSHHLPEIATQTRVVGQHYILVNARVPIQNREARRVVPGASPMQRDVLEQAGIDKLRCGAGEPGESFERIQGL